MARSNRRPVVYTTTTQLARQRTTGRKGIATIVRATACRVCLDPVCFGGESAHPWED